MAKFTYNVCTDEIMVECPSCGKEITFPQKEHRTEVTCDFCKKSYPIDPLRYLFIEAYKEDFEEALVKLYEEEIKPKLNTAHKKCEVSPSGD